LSAGSQVNSVAFSPDGTMLATGDGSQYGGESGGAATVWDLATGKRVNFVTGAQVNSVAFSPDSKTLATGDSDGAAVLWNLATRQATRLSTDADDIKSVAFSPDGTTLAVGGGNAVYLYDAATGQLISRLNSGSGGAYSYDQFSGYRMASRGTDSSQVTGEVNSVAFNRDGTRLAASFGLGGLDNLVTIWDTSFLADVPARVCSQVGNSLTSAEWERYLPSGPPYQAVCPRHP
jgi:WD40 repeat protein